jgi:hypothetical protein
MNMKSNVRAGAAMLAAIAIAIATSAAVAQTVLPVYVDLTANQSSVKSQGARDTCGTFATVSALEALYRRTHGVTLDLSEQYLNHWAQQFSSAGSGKALPLNETVVGSVGGGGLARPLAALSRGLSVPLEDTLPYIGDAGYQNVNPGDFPSLNDWSISYSQKEINDFNLADKPASYMFTPPTWVWTTVMPQSALDGARYGATGVTYLTAAEVKQVDKYRAILASGREVIMEFRCCDGNPGFRSMLPWKLPANSSGGGSGHVMTIVGYDHGRVKNSWGSDWADSGYAWVAYDMVTRAATGAAYLQGVVSPTAAFDPFSHKHFFLGRWQLNYDGWKGTLDIYNLPENYATTPGRNYRVGTLLMADGRVHRVNGYITGNALNFYVDWSQPNLPRSQLTGLNFKMMLSTRDHKEMAGTVRDAVWGTFPAAAVKASAPITGVARPGGLSVSSYLGTWDFSHDGWKGRLEITTANPVTRQLAGRYVSANGQAFALVGSANTDARLFNFQIAFATPQSFQGYLNGRELGVMGGTTTWSGLTFGFLGTRRR